MSAMGGGSASDSLFDLLKVMGDPKGYKAKLAEIQAAEEKANAALAKQQEANHEAASQLALARVLQAEANAKMADAKEIHDNAAGRAISLGEREEKVRARELKLDDDDHKFAEWRARATKEIEDQQRIVKQKADSILGHELELQSRKAEVDKMRSELAEKLDRIRALAT